MENIVFTVNKMHVYNEVAKTTGYTGAKMLGDESAYERIFTSDEDRLLLERFWNEACNVATGVFRQFMVSVSSAAESHCMLLERNYEITVSPVSNYNSALNDSIGSSLYSFFVNYIVSRWYRFTNKGEADMFASEATAQIEDVSRKLYHRQKPVKPQIN